MKAAFSLLAALLLAVTSVSLAGGQGHSAPAFWAELCGAHGESRLVALDARGKPMGDTPCIDCLPPLVLTASAAPHRPVSAAHRLVAVPVAVPAVFGRNLDLHARGPPAAQGRNFSEHQTG